MRDHEAPPSAGISPSPQDAERDKEGRPQMVVHKTGSSVRRFGGNDKGKLGKDGCGY